MVDIVTDKTKTQGLFGCAFDIGGTQCKVTYLKHGSDSSQKVTICCTNYKMEHLDQAIKVICENGVIKGGEKEHVLRTTGVSVRGSIKSALEMAFNVEVKNLSEFECQARATEFLFRSFPQSSIVISPPQTATDFVTGHVACYQQLTNKSKCSFQIQSNKVEESSGTFAESDPELYPYILAVCGTGCSFTIVKADGTVNLLTGKSCAGKTFCGLGSHLLNTRSYDDLLELAEQGDESRVSNVMGELKSSSDGDVYTAFPDDMTIFAFGKSVDGFSDGAEPSRADIARALLATMCSELGQFAYWVAKAQQCRRIFVTGGFVKNELVKELICKSFMDEALILYPDVEVEIYFLKHGFYLGSLGAFLMPPAESYT